MTVGKGQVAFLHDKLHILSALGLQGRIGSEDSRFLGGELHHGKRSAVPTYASDMQLALLDDPSWGKW